MDKCNSIVTLNIFKMRFYENMLLCTEFFMSLIFALMLYNPIDSWDNS